MAQAFKIPRGGNYPPLFGIAPQWWNNAVGSGLDQYLDQYAISEPDKEVRFRDPRWAGSFKKTFGSGTGNEVDFRALSFQHPGGTPASSPGRYLYLSWHIKVHPSATIEYAGSFIDVGFRPTTGSPVRYRITLLATANGGTTNAGSNAFYSEAASTYGVDTWGSPGSGLAWLRANTFVWTLGGMPGWWAVHMRVPVSPLAGGLDLTGTFGLGFYVESIGTPLSVDYRWPSGLAPSPSSTNPNPSAFQPCYLEVAGLSAGDTPLTTGVSLPEGNIGTTGVTATFRNPTTGVTYPISSPQAIYLNAGQVTNFLAKPRNDDPTTAINLTTAPIKTMTARFVLANWGSTPPGGPWRTLGSGTIPAGGMSSATLAAGGGTADIPFQWSPTSAEEAFFRANPHQCMMVDLSTTDPSITFLNASSARNMDFGSVSKFVRSSVISVQGLSDGFALPQRDVYIYVERVNMPQTIDDETRGKYDRVRELLLALTTPERDYAPEQRFVSIVQGDLRHFRFFSIPDFLGWLAGSFHEGVLVITNPDVFEKLHQLQIAAGSIPELIDRDFDKIRARLESLEYDDNGQPLFTERERQIIDLLLDNIAYLGQIPPAIGELPPVEDLEQFIPTVRYYVYHDTGRRITVDGVVRPVVESQHSFGYYLWLDHQVDSWELRLQGAQKLAENLYLVRPPTEGETTVTTSIHAVQEGEQDQIEPPEPIVDPPVYEPTPEDRDDAPPVAGCLDAGAQLLEGFAAVLIAIARLVRWVTARSRQ